MRQLNANAGDASPSFRAAIAPIDLSHARRVLVVKRSSFGDVVHLTPCLRALRQACPDAEIIVAVDRTWAPILRSDPHLDAVVEADPARRRFIPSLLEARDRLKSLPGARFDLAIDFQGRSRSAAWIYASKARFQGGRGGFRPGWQSNLRPDLQRHALEVCAEIARSFGIAVTDLEPRLFITPSSDQSLGRLLKEVGAPERGFIVANPFSTWRSKVWPVERWAILIRKIRVELGIPVVISGGPNEVAEQARLAALLGPSAAPSLVGKMLIEEAICLYRRALFMITGDTGPMHAAAAVGTPVVALFGATWPEQTGPWGSRHRVLQRSRSEFHHAYPDEAERRHIEALDVETVFAAAADLNRELSCEIRLKALP
jgi:heptosyltransferase I